MIGDPRRWFWPYAFRNQKPPPQPDDAFGARLECRFGSGAKGKGFEGCMES